MPRRDGTGPMGMGAMTGRGMGCCSYDDIGLKKINTSSYGYGLGREEVTKDFYLMGGKIILILILLKMIMQKMKKIS